MKKNHQKIKVWDASVRLFHLALIILVSLSLWSGFQDKLGTGYDTMHLYAGVGIIVLILSRIIWGFLGSTTARFSDFITSPKAVWQYFTKKQPYKWAGHNPAGGWMVVILLLLLLTQAILGLYSFDDVDFYGPLNFSISEESASIVMWLHKQLGIVLMGIISLHILATILTQTKHKVNLIKAMITGEKPKENVTLTRPLKFKSIAWFLFLVCVLGYGLYSYLFS